MRLSGSSIQPSAIIATRSLRRCNRASTVAGRTPSKATPFLSHQVVSGEAVEVEYVTCLAGPMGDWHNHHVVLRPLVGERLGFLVKTRALGGRRRRIDSTQLSGRELEVSADFYSGLDISAIAVIELGDVLHLEGFSAASSA